MRMAGCNMRCIGLIFMLMCLYLDAEAQIRIVPREKLSSITDPTLSETSASLRFDATRIEAEPMTEDDGIQNFTYSFENLGKDTLTVGRLVSSCTCISAACSRKTVAPGETSDVVVRYNPKGHPGKFERRIFVYMEGDMAPAAILRLAVRVENGKDMSGLYPVSMGKIRLRRNEVNITKGVKTVERCPFVNVSDMPFNVECECAMLPGCLSFRAEPEIVVAGGEGELVITYDPSVGGEKEQMIVLLKGLGVPPSQAAVVVKMKNSKGYE